MDQARRHLAEVPLVASRGGLELRRARADDLPALLALLGQLHSGGPAEPQPVPPAATFESILANPDRAILVAVRDATLLGSVDLHLVENITHEGRPWAELEKVVVDEHHRGEGIGGMLVDAAVEMARAAGAYKVQLVSDARRERAHDFYSRLGFDVPVVGFRRYLDPAGGPPGAGSLT